MKANTVYDCPMCGSQFEDSLPEGASIPLRTERRCKLCGARLYNHFILRAKSGSWVALMEEFFPRELSEIINRLKQVKE